MKEKYPDFFHYLLGDVPIGALYAFIIWALIAATISLLVNVINRDPASAATPVKTNWKFMLLDNLLRLIVNVLAIPVFIRVALLFFDLKYMFVVAIVIGVCVDRLALRLKNLGLLAGDRFTKNLLNKLQADDPNIKPKEPGA